MWNSFLSLCRWTAGLDRASKENRFVSTRITNRGIIVKRSRIKLDNDATVMDFYVNAFQVGHETIFEIVYWLVGSLNPDSVWHNSTSSCAELMMLAL
jgi:hypothetical protein